LYWSNFFFATLFCAVCTQGWNYPWFVFKYDNNNDITPEIFTSLGDVQTFLNSDEPRAKAHRRFVKSRQRQEEADVDVDVDEKEKEKEKEEASRGGDLGEGRQKGSQNGQREENERIQGKNLAKKTTTVAESTRPT